MNLLGIGCFLLLVSYMAITQGDILPAILMIAIGIALIVYSIIKKRQQKQSKNKPIDNEEE